MLKSEGFKIYIYIFCNDTRYFILFYFSDFILFFYFTNFYSFSLAMSGLHCGTWDFSCGTEI